MANANWNSEDRTSHMVLEVIKSHVANRGLGFPSDPATRQEVGSNFSYAVPGSPRLCAHERATSTRAKFNLEINKNLLVKKVKGLPLKLYGGILSLQIAGHTFHNLG